MDTPTVRPTTDTRWPEGWREWRPTFDAAGRRTAWHRSCGTLHAVGHCPATTDTLPPCELLELDPVCDVCDGTGEVTDAPGRAGRAVLPCLNCDAYDRLQEQLADAYTESRED